MSLPAPTARRAIAVVVLALSGCADDGAAPADPAASTIEITAAPTIEITAAASTTTVVTATPGTPRPSLIPPPSSADPADATTLPATTVPAAFAERTPYRSCGEDFSLELDGVGPPSAARDCLLVANRKGASAELIAHEVVGPLDGAPDVVYRTNADRSVDIFVPGRPWRVAHCDGLAADDRMVFTVVGCDEPVAIE